MSDATLSADGDGRWVLGGDLDFSGVAGIWPAVEERVRQPGQLVLSLRAVGHVNSAGLAMLLEARDVARRHDCALSVTDLPADVVDLARMSGCEALL